MTAAPVPRTEVARVGVRALPSNQSAIESAARPKATDGIASSHSTPVMANGSLPWSGAAAPRPRKAISHSRAA